MTVTQDIILANGCVNFPRACGPNGYINSGTLIGVAVLTVLSYSPMLAQYSITPYFSNLPRLYMYIVNWTGHHLTSTVVIAEESRVYRMKSCFEKIFSFGGIIVVWLLSESEQQDDQRNFLQSV